MFGIFPLIVIRLTTFTQKTGTDSVNKPHEPPPRPPPRHSPSYSCVQFAIINAISDKTYTSTIQFDVVTYMYIAKIHLYMYTLTDSWVHHEGLQLQDSHNVGLKRPFLGKLCIQIYTKESF